MWKCMLCDESYCKRSNYQRHLNSEKHLASKKFNEEFSAFLNNNRSEDEFTAFANNNRSELLKINSTSQDKWRCNVCDESFSQKYNFQRHLTRTAHQKNVLKTDKIRNISVINNNNYELRRIESAFQNRLETFLITNTNDRKKVDNLATFLEGTTDFLLFTIKKQLETKTALLVNLKVCAKFKRITGEEQEFALKTSNIKIFRNDIGLKLSIKINGLYADLTAELQDLEKKGSGWSYKYTTSMEVSIN